MTKITYKPEPGDPQETEWDGRRFKAGEAVDLDGRVASNKNFIERAKANPFFDVDGEAPAPKKSDGDPSTPEEYRAYAIGWIKTAKSSAELEGRWKDEQPMRAKVGWGSDDQALIDPIYGPKLETVKAAEAG